MEDILFFLLILIVGGGITFGVGFLIWKIIKIYMNKQKKEDEQIKYNIEHKVCPKCHTEGVFEYEFSNKDCPAEPEKDENGHRTGLLVYPTIHSSTGKCKKCGHTEYSSYTTYKYERDD